MRPCPRTSTRSARRRASSTSWVTSRTPGRCSCQRGSTRSCARAPGEGVEGAEGLVEQQQVGRAVERPRHADALCLAAREAASATPSPCPRARPRRARRARPLPGAGPTVLEHDVLPDPLGQDQPGSWNTTEVRAGRLARPAPAAPARRGCAAAWSSRCPTGRAARRTRRAGDRQVDPVEDDLLAVALGERRGSPRRARRSGPARSSGSSVVQISCPWDRPPRQHDALDAAHRQVDQDPEECVDEDAGDDDVDPLELVGVVEDVADAGPGVDLLGGDEGQQRSTGPRSATRRGCRASTGAARRGARSASAAEVEARPELEQSGVDAADAVVGVQVHREDRGADDQRTFDSPRCRTTRRTAARGR